MSILKKISNKLLAATLVFIVFIVAACNSTEKWHKASVVYFDDFSEELMVKPKNSTYYTFIKAKHIGDSGKVRILIPEEVKLIQGDDFAFVSMFFDEENYGMETWSFGKVLGGDSVVIAETKFQFKTCACKTAGKFFHGYFVVAGDKHLKVRTDNKNNVYNRGEIYDFVEKYYHHSLPQEINTINDLILFLENINN
ncbi:MAG: hypothetical protein PHE56_04435 [Bacteroidales bacterium]|jgi:hypothetical protein|nr:hypothetical protein [Bacteroidales bacterium]